jgi:hypothetical protein
VPRSCTVCSHPESFAINEALVIEGTSNRAITRLYGLSKDAVRRHREHTPQLLVESLEAEEVAAADTLLEKVEELRLKAMAVLEEAEEAHDHRIMLAAIDRASRQLELLAKLLGELQQEGTTNIIVSPQWLEVKAVILGAVDRHPEVLGEIEAAFERAEKLNA